MNDVRSHAETILIKLEWDGLEAKHWKAIENVAIFLKSFLEHNSISRGKDYITISCVVPILMELKLHLQKVNL